MKEPMPPPQEIFVICRPDGQWLHDDSNLPYTYAASEQLKALHAPEGFKQRIAVYKLVGMEDIEKTVEFHLSTVAR